MASADLLGSMCWVVPKRIGVGIIAFLFFLFGLAHLIIMIMDIVYALVGSHSVARAHACQGSACHQEWREETFTCEGFRSATFHLRYLTLGVLGPFFGALGVKALLDRSYIEMRGFATFLSLTWLLYLGCFITDVLFINLCNSYPTSILRDVVPWLPSKAMATVHALGYPTLDRLTLRTVEMALGFDIMIPYSVGVFAGLLLAAYAIANTWDLNEKMEGGPVGLGPLYLIATPADREIATITAAIAQAKAEDDTKYEFYSALGRLKDSERYPFVTTKGPQEPIGYGAVGLPMPDL